MEQEDEIKKMAEYIEREAFLEKMKKTDRYFMVKFDIEEFPTADVAPVVHGRWLSSVDNDCEMHKCDQCGARVVKSTYECENPNRYCYYCGARMDGSDESA